MLRVFQWLDKHKKILLTVCNICILILTIIGWQKKIFTNQKEMSSFLNSCGIFAPVFFLMIQAVQVVIPILPGAIGCLYGVIFWGPVKGFILNYIGICAGSVWAFLIARNYGKDLVIRMTGNRFYERYSKYLLKEKQFEKIFALLIFLPVAPDDFLCYLAGISQLTLRKFIVIILLGKPLAILLYSLGLNQAFQGVLKLIA